MKRTRSLFVAISLAALFGRPLHAAGTKEAEREARRSFQEAEAHFRAGEFAEALSAYEAGYAQAPLPGFLINIAQCYRRLGDLTRARATYQKFVMVAPDSPHVPEVTNLIAEIDKLLAQLEQEHASAPAPLASAGSATGDATLPLTLAAAPPASPAPNLLEPPVASTPVAPAPPETPPATSKTRWWLWGLAGAAVVVAGGTAAAFALGGGTSTVHQGSLGALRR